MGVLSLALLCTATAVTVASAETPPRQQCSNTLTELIQQPAPFVSATTWLPSTIPFQNMGTFTVQSFSAIDETESYCDAKTGEAMLQFTQVAIGKAPQFTPEDAVSVLDSAVDAWQNGAGVWTTQYTTQQRADAIRSFLAELRQKREEIVTILQWEIGKNRVDAESEFDRTIQFGEQLIHQVLTDPEYTGQWNTVPGTSVTALTKRAAIGIILVLAPYNYPLNESYATILPALLTGNICILKIPMTGGLAHLLTMEAFAKTLPPGTMNFISGQGQSTMPPLMGSGKIDGLAFVGAHKVADRLIMQHPHPHRLHTFLQLEAKNMGIILPDLFEPSNSALLENALDESILGSLSYNGQRCTALKLFFVPKKHAKTFVLQLAERVEALTVGLPWQNHTSSSSSSSSPQGSQITPLPNHGRMGIMKNLINDAVNKGARIVNDNGGTTIGGPQSTLLVPAVVYPVRSDMKLYTDEQFGPIVPIAVYDELEEVLLYGQTGAFAQQVSVFGQDVALVAKILDRFGAVFGKVNLNAQCGRSPDTLAFSGRRSSAMGVMSVTEILREFTVPTVVAYKNNNGLNDKLVQGLDQTSVFLGAAKADH